MKSDMVVCGAIMSSLLRRYGDFFAFIGAAYKDVTDEILMGKMWVCSSVWRFEETVFLV